MIKLLGAMIDLDYAKGLEEEQFKKEFYPIYGALYIDDAWAEVEKLKGEGAKSFRKAK